MTDERAALSRMSPAKREVARLTKTYVELRHGPKKGEPLTSHGFFSVLAGRGPDEAAEVLRKAGWKAKVYRGPGGARVFVVLEGGAIGSARYNPSYRSTGRNVAAPSGYDPVTVLPRSQVGDADAYLEGL